MKTFTLGKSKIPVSAVTLGCMTFTGDSNWGPQDEKDSVATIRAALDAGIVSFDTAESYAAGLTESILGKALGADRARVSIFSKVATTHLGYKEVIHACEGTLSRLGTDYIDLYQIHWPNPQLPIEETMEALLLLQKQGKIREIGVSNFGAQDLDTVLSYGAVVTDQLAYNMLFRGIEFSVLPKCRANGIGVLTYSSLAQGLLSGKYHSGDEFPVGRARTKIFAGTREGARHGGTGCEDLAFGAIRDIQKICDEIGEPMADVALAWSLTTDGILSTIAGGRTPEQAITNARAGNLTLSPDVIDALTKATEPVKAFLGDDADPWAYGRIH